MDFIEHAIAGRYAEIWSRYPAPAPTTGTTGALRRAVVVEASTGPSHAAPGGAAGPPRNPLAALLDPLLAADPALAAIIFEEDPTAAAEFRGALPGSARPEGHDADPGRWSDPAPGEVRVAESRLDASLPALLEWLGGDGQALVYLAPPGPDGLPFSTIRALAEHPGVDLLLRLPTSDLRRLARFRSSPVADLPLHPRRLAESYSRFFGDARWEWLGLWRAVEAERGSDAAAEALCARFRERLAAAVPNSTVRRFAVPLSAGMDTLQLLLATLEPERMLEMNRVLFEARGAGLLPWAEPADPRVSLEDPGTLDLFAPRTPTAGAPHAGSAAPRIRTCELAAVASQIAARFGVGTATLRDVMGSVVDSELFAEEVRQALKLLRRERRAWYPRLRSCDDPIRFGDVDPAPGPRGRRHRAPEEPGLW